MSDVITAEVEKARRDAGWKKSASGWVAPCGTPESAWREAGYALPEDPFYVDWRQPFEHYQVET